MHLISIVLFALLALPSVEEPTQNSQEEKKPDIEEGKKSDSKTCHRIRGVA